VKQIVLAFLSVVMGLSGVGQTQVQPNNKPAMKTSVVPNMVRFAGIAKDLDSKPLSGVTGITFLLYKDEQGGTPLWLETQNVQPDSTGRYSVMLGVTKADGLPVELFRSGDAQWLGVQIAGQPEQPRVLLLSVPYALKAGDAQTLGGQLASAFMTVLPLGAGNSTDPAGTITGGGTANFVPLFTGTTTIGNSKIFQTTGGNVGIATTTPAAKLDVKGTGDFRDTLTLFPKTTHPALSISGTAFQVSSTGTVTFVSGQTFPGTGTITGVTAGTDLTGGGTNGNVTLNLNTTATDARYAQLNANNAFTKTMTFAAGQTFPGTGTVTSVALTAPASDFTVGGSPITGAGTLNLGWTQAPTSANTANAIVKRDSLGNFATNSVTASSLVSSGLSATTVSAGSVIVNGPISGVAGNFSGGVSASTQTDANFVTGILGQQLGVSNATIGVEGVSNSVLGIGVFGNAYSLSGIGAGLFPSARGIWGDSGLAGGIGVVATTDDGFSLLAVNNSTNDTTAFFENEESTNSATVVMETDGPFFNGQCVIDVSGNLACTGSKSAVVPVDNGTRKVALYAVEAPENWFEDFGSGQLSNGAAVIAPEPTFSQTVNAAIDYHVFLTPRGECEGLYVANTSATGFEVRELHHGSSSVAFDYRIVARRKGYENIRMADKTAQFQNPEALSSRKGTTLRTPAPPRPQTSKTISSVIR